MRAVHETGGTPGDVYRSLGLGEEARTAYLHSLALTERLAAQDPSNAAWQRDLSVAHSRLGDVYRSLGLGEEARTAYLHSLALTERLAAQDPNNAAWQRDLVASLVRAANTSEEEEAKNLLLRAKSIAQPVKGETRLSQLDDSTVAALTQALEERGLTSQLS